MEGVAAETKDSVSFLDFVRTIFGLWGWRTRLGRGGLGRLFSLLAEMMTFFSKSWKGLGLSGELWDGGGYSLELLYLIK